MARILILSPEIPYPVFKGNQNRIDETLSLLLNLGHDVFLVALNSIQPNRTSASIVRDLRNRYPEISGVEVRRHPRYSSGIRLYVQRTMEKFERKSWISNFNTAPLGYRKAVSQAIDKFKPEFILVNYLKLTRAIPKTFKGVTVIDCHDLQSIIVEQAEKLKPNNKNSVDLKSFSDEEFFLLSKYNYIVSINENETRLISQRLPNANIETIPAFCKVAASLSAEAEYDLLFVGSSSPFNIEGIVKFLAKAFPKIKKSISGAKIAIVGDVSNCSALKKHDNDPQVVKLGRVDDINSVYRKAKVVISPILSGAGMKVKNIEAFCQGKAVVATGFSLDGVNATHGLNVVMADDWDAFAKGCIELLTNESLRRKIEAEARNLAISQYSLDAAASKLTKIFGVGTKQAVVRNETSSGLSANPTNYGISTVNSLLSVATHASEASAKSRTKGLVFSTDAMSLIRLNLYLGKIFRRLGVYTEFFKMDGFSDNEFLKEGFVAHSLRPCIDKSLRKRLLKELRFDVDHNKFVSNLIWRNVDFSEEINIYRKMFPGHFEKSDPKSIVVHGIVILEALLELIDKVKPTFLVGWNGNGPHLVFLVKIAAKIKRLPVFHVERGLLPDTLVFDSRGVNFKSSAAGSFLPVVSDVERLKARSYIDKFRRDRRTVVNGVTKSNLSERELKAALGLCEGEDYLLFVLQIEGDSNIVINSPFFKEMGRVIEILVNVSREVGLRLVCRPHPEGPGCDDLSRVFPGVIFDNSCHLHDVLQCSVANVVINSTVGLESLLLGRPTIALGFSVYSNKGLSLDACDERTIIEAISRVLRNDIDRRTSDRKLEELVCYLRDYCLLDLNDESHSASVANLVLTCGGVSVINKSLPGVPRRARLYQEKRSGAFQVFNEKRKGVVLNCLKPNTFQYLNGASKPLVTSEMICDFFSKFFPDGLQVVACQRDFLQLFVNKYKSESVCLIVLRNSDSENFSVADDVYCFDEFFNIQFDIK